MQLTMMGEYAIRAVFHICGSEYGTVFQISDIAKENSIPDNFLRKIVPLLCKAKILSTIRGASGGVKLQKKSFEITPLHIVEATEGRMALNKCLLHNELCENEKWCSMHFLWAEAQKKIKETLSQKNFEQLVTENKDRLARLNSKHINVKPRTKKQE